MINLMPDDVKKELRAARVNVMLARYIGILVLAGLFLALVLFGSFYLLNQSRESSLKLIEANGVKADVYSSTKAQVNELSGSLAGARDILDQEVRYSNILINFAQLMPTGTVIDKITLDTTAFNAPITVSVYAQTTDDAVALRDRFQGSSLFTDVNFQSISETGGIQGYPVSATMTLTLNKAAAQ